MNSKFYPKRKKIVEIVDHWLANQNSRLGGPTAEDLIIDTKER